ncbi:LLM class flavin-dependent oxidoreductase [Gemmobacter fulvus]|uniref:LLM class flavin-dependent oxidoreductase n=1 Tax=Gemmobacter fulvus TaxID=2840474 RepID=UPI002796B33E|nr:LLM class flavin-dependent oxidoreductase [Gemmobacter fulvus]MDQ1848084.1 LLM class flavin-dependent oxidoreductase [Gemmobacter fulvus]
MTQIPLSLLELVRVTETGGPRRALLDARAIATHVEALGFQRLWVAEHHNMQGIASAATSVVLAHIAEGTSRLRIGAGGIMLPNHAPYIIAEQFGTLAQLHPGRIDLALGRAPGTDQATLRAIRQHPGASDRFPQDVVELMGYFAPEDGTPRIRAVPAPGTEVDFFILGSSHFGAMLAAELGLPYGFASHFAPDYLHEALHLYRAHFKATAARPAPHAVVGVNVVCAETEAEARRLFTTQQQSFTGIFRNARGLSQPPIDDIESFWTPRERAQVMGMLRCHVVGSPEQVRAGLQALVAQTQADELMLVTDIYDFEARCRSLTLTAEAWR